MANAENRSYPLKRKVLMAAGIVSGLGMMGHGAVAGPSDEALDYTIYSKNIDGVVDQTKQFRTEKGEQAVILLQGVKEELERNPEFKNAKRESGRPLIEVLVGGGVGIVSLVGGTHDIMNYHRRRRRKMFR